MQAQSVAGGAATALKSSAGIGAARSNLALVPRRRRSGKNPGNISVTASFMTPAFDSTTTFMTSVQGFATGAAWLAVAAMGAQLLFQQDSTPREGAVECETCHGSGVVDCLVCTRWSDSSNDSSGCGCCAGSRKMACSSCGGGGTAVPSKVYIKRESEYY